MKTQLHNLAESYGMNFRSNNGPIYALVGLTAFLTLIVAIVVLFAKGDTQVKELISYIGTIVPLVLGYVFINGKVNSVESKTEEVRQNVNGKLDRRLDELGQQIQDLNNNGIPDDQENDNAAS